MKKVLHIFRKLLPNTASFIRNQIIYHSSYKPYILYAEEVPSSISIELKSHYQHFLITKKKKEKLIYDKYRILLPSVQKRAIQYIKEINPDVIHVHYGVDMLVFSNILNKIDIPVIVSFYGYDCTSFPSRFNGLGKLLLKKYVFNNRNLKIVFAMSPDMQNDLISIGCPDSLIQIHYYGSECKKFFHKREYIDKNVINFTIISSLVEKKGHLILLDAWSKASKLTKKNIKLNIIGSGEMRENIISFINNKVLKNVILRDGIVYGSQEHFNILKEADVFIHPSKAASNGDKEGIPGTIIEAMASGLPIISTFHAGIPSIVKNENMGLLVKENNVQQLANAIMLLAENNALRKIYGINAQRFAISDLDVTSKEKELESFYNNII